ncbi:GNAT family N-acetyltransferase [Vagococcus lutrae]|uniref:GNAT family N-acetyltransferase n=1 Tax=Vagococcus lutrae TaxID=81947 RepID=UPI00200C5EB8|nr:GNAT family N-acetyltransferase [Vagococcus lutrae]MDT2805340.1 GNAT family N-acetyltransferase [Vagococcus lutrae]MDT2824998.1 GNAT family N-acetyltransferase [Vagococcus lutrae]UQF19388.1 GNAT family N-acetyltransferase [Vagococcus lutrae]
MIRRLSSEADIQAMYELSSYAFKGFTPESFDDQTYRLFQEKALQAHNYGFFMHQNLVSKIMSFPFTVNVYNKEYRMGGIGNVASYPEARGQGAIRQLFTSLFDDYRENNTVLSYLAPFSHHFYRKFGYATAMDEETCTIQGSDLPTFPMDDRHSISRFSVKDNDILEDLKRIYKKTLATEHGSLQRDDWWWQYQINKYPNRHVALLSVDGQAATSYLIYEMNASQLTFNVIEMASSSIDELKSLCSFIKSHISSYHTFIFKHGLTNDLSFLLQEPGSVKRQLETSMMIRIVLFQSFIESFPLALVGPNQTLTIYVEDKFCEWNHGNWEVTRENNQHVCRKIDSSQATDLSGSIETWTQLLFNYKSAQQLHVSGKLTGDIQHLDFLNMTNQPQPYIYDYF